MFSPLRTSFARLACRFASEVDRARPGEHGRLRAARAGVAAEAGKVACTCLVIMVVVGLVSGCQATTEIGEVDDVAVGPAEPTAVPDSVDPVPMTTAEVYRQISQSVVFIETPDLSSGTGIVIEGGWILTNAHIVERSPTVRIGRSDGVDLGSFEVFSVDGVFDLALVGPVDDPALVPMQRVSTGALAIGDRVYLIGFPDEASSDATPTFTEGIVSRRRRPALGDFPFLQVDATIAPGQSGGALVDADGRLMGISAIEFGAGEFGLALEGDAMWPRIERLMNERTIGVPTGQGVSSIADEIGPHRTLGFAIEVDESGSIDLAATSDDDIALDLQTLGGITLTESPSPADHFDAIDFESGFYIDEVVEGGEQLIATVEPGTYQVIVSSFGSTPGPVEVTSANVLHPFDDLEEGATLPVGRIVEGDIGWAGDSDRWLLPLRAGQKVTIVTDGLADTILAVRLDGVVVASSDDDGLGIFGTGAQVEFDVEADATYEVEVGSFDTVRWGYLIEVTIG